MVFPSPRSGHNLKSLHKKGIIPLFGWYCPFWASYLFKAASGWPRGRFLHYKRCSTPAGVCPAVSSVCTGTFAAVGAFAVLRHSFCIVSAGLVGLCAVFMGLAMKTILPNHQKALCGPFSGGSSVGGLAVVLGVIFPTGRALMQGRIPSSAWGWLLQLTGAQSSWMNKMQGCPCGWYGYNAAARLPG